uniref:Wsv011-like protein n=1 Tax=Pasiphaea japonica whispovirus TaxID=2984286 RepID=A0A9C7F7G8_9VIRU|nr:MAG: wsv011-like protein [Pasiphaea japonica whispovirus]
MGLLTLTASTRRVATSKGNYTKEDAIIGNQYPIEKTPQKTTNNGRVSFPFSFHSYMETIIKNWYSSNCEAVYDISNNQDGWDKIMQLVEQVYDPVFFKSFQPSQLADVSCVTAATFAALASALDEKVTILTDVLTRATNVMLENKGGASTAEELLSNDAFTSILIHRLKLLEVAQHKNFYSTKEKEKILFRKAKLMQAPLPHRPSLFNNFGSGKNSETTAGTTSAAEMHYMLIEHIFKVAFKKWGPERNEEHRQQLTSKAKEDDHHPISKYILRYFEKSTINNINASIFYCDYYDYLAYKMMPDTHKPSSILPGSFDMEDLPFRPFVVPTEYMNANSRCLFKYERAISSVKTPSISFDYGEFLCYCVFGNDWYKHLGSIVDRLEYSSMETFPPDVFSGIYKDTTNFHLLNNERFGLADLALRSIVEFIRTEAQEAAIQGTTHPNRLDLDIDDYMSVRRLREKIYSAVKVIQNFIENGLPTLAQKFKVNVLPDGDQCGNSGEYESMTAHLFLTRILDQVHILRNNDIQRTVYSTNISLRYTPKSQSQTRSNCIQTYSSLQDLPSSIISGISGYYTASSSPNVIGSNLVISWDGSGGGKVISLWRSINNNFVYNHAQTLTDYDDKMQKVKKIKNVLKSNSCSLNPVYFKKKAVYDGLLTSEGMIHPGKSFTNNIRNFEFKLQIDDTVNHPRQMSHISAGTVRGFLSSFRDILEFKALTVTTASEFADFSKNLKNNIKTLSAVSHSETSFFKSLSSALKQNSTLGLEFSKDTQLITLRGGSTTLLDQTIALRENRITFSSFSKNLGLDVSDSLDADVAAEIQQTYPDSALIQHTKNIKNFKKKIPDSQVNKLKKLGEFVSLDENEEKLIEGINTTEFSKTTDFVLGKKLGNAITVVMGRFNNTSVLIGGLVVGGYLGSAAVSMMHASRGAHLNSVDIETLKGVTSYKLVDISCADKTLGWAYASKYHLRKEMDDIIKNDKSFSSTKGAYVISDKKETSKFRGFAHNCETRDAAASKSGGCWATINDPRSLLPWVAEGKDMPKGQTLSCDKGMTALEAVASVVLSLGKDIAEKIIEVAEDAVVDLPSQTFSKIIKNHPGFIFGVPIAVGITATGLQPQNWRSGLIAFVGVFTFIVVVRFFVGSGAFTLNWFNVGESAKRKNTEVKEEGGGKRAKITLLTKETEENHIKNKSFTSRGHHTNQYIREFPGHTILRPVFYPATTNYSRAANIIGIENKTFEKCYKQILLL